MLYIKEKISKFKQIPFMNRKSFSLIWEYALTAFVLSILFSFLAYELFSGSQKYTQLVVGSITWRMASKGQDYLLMVSLLVSMPIIYIGLHLLSRLVHRNQGEASENVFRRFCGYSMLPFGIWMGSELTGLSSNLGLVLLSCLLAVAVIGTGAITAIRSFKFLSDEDYSKALGSSVLSLIFSTCSGLAFVLAVGRLNLSWQLDRFNQVILVAGTSILCCLVPFLFIWLASSHNTLLLNQRLQGLLLAAQGLMPLFFLVLIPAPWFANQNKFYGYEITFQLAILVGALVITAYIDWLRRLYKHLKGGIERYLVVSPVCLLALLLFLKTADTSFPSVSPDDYHYGEFLLPWWLWRKAGYIPFQDYEAARGLVNYVPGFLANLFFDGTAGSYTAVFGQAIMVLPFLAVGFFTVAQTVGWFPAFVVFVLTPNAGGLFEIYILLTAAFCYLCNEFFKRQWSRWLLAWGIIGTALVLFAPGQGALFVLAMAPLGAISLYKAIRDERRELLYTLIAIGVGVTALAVLTPLDGILIGAIRYGAEQSSTNSTAYGVEWSASNDSNPFFGYLLWEIVRTSWVAVGVATALLLYRILPDQTWPNRQRFCVFAVPVVLAALLWIPRAAGRIDPASLSRLGEASLWFVCLLLPIILLVAYNFQKKSPILMAFVFFAGLLSTNVGSIPNLEQIIRRPLYTVDVTQIEFTKGSNIGLPNLGTVVIDSSQLNRLQLVRGVLKAVLEPGETYLDLTSRNAHYFYLDYPSPISTGAVYNLVHEEQQFRALNRLESLSPPVVLASADSMLFDGGTVSLRSHLIYRYVVNHYVPVLVDQLIFMVKPDRLTRIESFLESSSLPNSNLESLDESQIQLLDRVFRNPDLAFIPSAWGQSFDTLRSNLQPVQDISANVTPSLNSVEVTSPGHYQVVGSDPSISFNLEPFNLNGQDAGLLAFDVACKQSDANPVLEVYWSSDSLGGPNESMVARFSARDGKVLVPLDADPRWLLAKGINMIRIDLVEPPACDKFSVENLQLFQRESIEEAEALISSSN